jgi:hypothetical protein
MTTYNNISGDYNIVTVDPTSNVIITTKTMVVDGNLDVMGNLTYIESTQTQVTDPFIQLAANNTGGVSNVGIIATKTANTNAGLRFNSTSNSWQVSSSVNSDGTAIAPYANIVTGTALTVGGANTNIQFNDSGALGGTGNLLFDKSTNQLSVLNGDIRLGNVGTSPTAVANSVVIYNNTSGGGGTGLYVKSTTSDDELISKSKAIVYSIIL